MRRIPFFILGLSFFLVSLSFAQDFSGRREEPLILAPAAGALPVGETLQYSAEWLGIPVGTVTLKIAGIVKIDGHDCYHITAKAMPNNFLRYIVDLEYQVDSYLDVDSLSSRRFEKVRRLKGEVNHVVINFNQEKGRVDYKSEGIAKGLVLSPDRAAIFNSNAPVLPVPDVIPENTQDLLSSLYYFRLFNFTGGRNKYTVNIYYHQKNWEVGLEIGKPFRKDIHKKGRFVLFPVSLVSGLNDFILGKHRFTVYFTVDPSRLPVEFKFDTGIGSIRARLKNIPAAKNGKI